MIENLHEFFEEHNDEFLKFDRVENKLSLRPDLHAFLLLDKLISGKGDMVSNAEHDEIYLDVDVEKLLEVATEAELIDLHRCGVLVFSEYDSLGMFV
jgi:hypothetical protein